MYGVIVPLTIPSRQYRARPRLIDLMSSRRAEISETIE